jgi:hypothetical protein
MATTTVAKTVATTSNIITLIMSQPPDFRAAFMSRAGSVARAGQGGYCAADTAEAPLQSWLMRTPMTVDVVLASRRCKQERRGSAKARARSECSRKTALSVTSGGNHD